jgi:hypothetical protein
MALPDQPPGRFTFIAACQPGAPEDVSYVAMDEEQHERVVIQTAPVTPRQSPGAVLFRLKKDLEISRRVRHPGLIGVRTLGIDERRGPYLVREYVLGPSLSALPGMEVDLAAALRILVQVAHALAAADAAGVAPEALRLQQIFITGAGQARLHVFGLPHAAAPSSAASAAQLARASLELIVGQAAREDAGARRTPSLPATLDKGLARSISRALAAAAEERFASPAEFMQVLVAEAPLAEAEQEALLELLDRTDPIVEDAVVAAWARKVWGEQPGSAVALGPMAPLPPRKAPGLSAAALPPPLRGPTLVPPPDPTPAPVPARPIAAAQPTPESPVLAPAALPLAAAERSPGGGEDPGAEPPGSPGSGSGDVPGSRGPVASAGLSAPAAGAAPRSRAGLLVWVALLTAATVAAVAAISLLRAGGAVPPGRASAPPAPAEPQPAGPAQAARPPGPTPPAKPASGPAPTPSRQAAASPAPSPAPAASDPAPAQAAPQAKPAASKKAPAAKPTPEKKPFDLFRHLQDESGRE